MPCWPALTKGPTYFSPDRHPDRAQERLAYVLGRMQEDGAISAAEVKQASTPLPALVAYEQPRRDIGFHFVDHLAREAKALAGIDALTANSYTVHSTILPDLQRATEAALQEGLAALRNRWRSRRVPGARGQSRRTPSSESQAGPETPHHRSRAWLQALGAGASAAL